MRGLHRLLNGFVRVRLTGLSPERFFNLCRAAGLELWDVSFHNGEYEFCIQAGDFFSCGPFTRKAKVRLKILKKFGLPFFLYRNRKRKMWAVGFTGFFVLLYVMSLFVWDIDYRGNVTYTEDELTHYLESLAITGGILKKAVSCEELEENLRNKFEGITWVSARLSGTRLYIHIKENEVPLEIQVKDETPCDLVAASDGVITSLIVRKGVPVVKAGDKVEKGQLLVSGRIPITNDVSEVVTEHLVHADADISGKRTRVEAKQFPLWHEEAVPTGELRRGLSIQVMDKSFVWLLPNFRNTEWRTVTELKQVTLFQDFCLPIKYGLITSSEVSVSGKKYSENQLNEMAEQYKNEVSENLMEKGVQIIENNVKILVNDSVCRLEAELLTEEAMDESNLIGDDEKERVVGNFE